MEKKMKKVHIDHGFGFPVKLIQVPLIRVRGQWTPAIDYNRLSLVVLRELAHKKGRLSGAEVKFIRQHFELTLQAFSKRFGVSHVAVIKWEKTDQKLTQMSWSTEKDIRLFVLDRLHSKSQEMASLYKELETVPPMKSVSMEFDAVAIAA